MNRSRMLVLLTYMLAVASPARAQSTAWTDRGYFTAGVDVRLAAASVVDVVHPVVFAEPAVVSTTYDMKASPGFAVGGGARVWRNLAIGVEATRVSGTQPGSVDAQVPHPFVFGKPRGVSGEGSFERADTALHVQALWMIPLNARWRMSVEGGPSWISVRQVLVTDVSVTQTYPYDTATFAAVQTQQTTASHVGFNAGVGATRLLSRRAGVGVSASFSRAHIPLSASAATDAGGLHLNGGLRLLF